MDASICVPKRQRHVMSLKRLKQSCEKNPAPVGGPFEPRPAPQISQGKVDEGRIIWRGAPQEKMGYFCLGKCRQTCSFG